ncbi:MAG TPA: hypothetical protein VFI16_04415 [Anaeromyxobacteraceae bacterium]|nr:hypothetical protein [Anaeromyxobacteraceae bacterium]
MIGWSVSLSLREGAGVRVVVLAAAAAVLACGVKAPPRPPEKAGVAGSKHDLRAPEAAGGGAAGGEPGAGASDGGTGRP